MLKKYIFIIYTFLSVIAPRACGETDPASRVKRFSVDTGDESEPSRDLMMRFDLKYGDKQFRASGRQKNRHDWVEQLNLPGLFRSVADAVGLKNGGSHARSRSDSKPNYYQVKSDSVLKAMDVLLKSGAADKMASELARSAARMYRRYSEIKNRSQ